MSKEEREQIKKEITEDLGRGYFKMNIAKIVTLIGCTITCCITVFGGILYLERNVIETRQNTKDIQSVKTEMKSIWNECGYLQTQINNHIENHNK